VRSAQVHGHYADAGEVAALVASTMASTEEVDMVMTGHSLGRNKLEHLMASGEWLPLGQNRSRLGSCSNSMDNVDDGPLARTQQAGACQMASGGNVPNGLTQSDACGHGED